jgi:1,6-anhydro-N-acetylmuramate kinase
MNRFIEPLRVSHRDPYATRRFHAARVKNGLLAAIVARIAHQLNLRQPERVATSATKLTLTVLTREDIGRNRDFQAGLLFALPMHETIHNRPGNLPTLTGAKRCVVLGQSPPETATPHLLRETLC